MYEYTPKAIESATAAVTKALAMRRNENVTVFRDSIFRQSSGMKFALASGMGHAAWYARNRASSLSSSLPRIEFIIPQLPGFTRVLPFLPCSKRF